MAPLKKKLLLAASIFLVALDQATKLAATSHLAGVPEGQAVRIIRGVLYLKPTQNPGGIWGLLGELPPWVFVGLSLVFVAYLVWLMLALKAPEHGYLPPLALLLGGFIGNGIDRLRLGYVTDFIYVTGYPPWMPSTFNVADLAILLGIAWLVGRFCLQSLRAGRGEQEAA